MEEGCEIVRVFSIWITGMGLIEFSIRLLLVCVGSVRGFDDGMGFPKRLVWNWVGVVLEFDDGSGFSMRWVWVMVYGGLLIVFVRASYGGLLVVLDRLEKGEDCVRIFVVVEGSRKSILDPSGVLVVRWVWWVMETRIGGSGFVWMGCGSLMV